MSNQQMFRANAAAPAKIPDSFRRYLKQHTTEDHEKLDELLGDAACLAEHRWFYTAAKKFDKFRIRQEQNMAAEEEIVFPLVETVFPGSPEIPEAIVERQAIRQAMEVAGTAISEIKREQFERFIASLQLH